jgi:hypothetical protein
MDIKKAVAAHNPGKDVNEVGEPLRGLPKIGRPRLRAETNFACLREAASAKAGRAGTEGRPYGPCDRAATESRPYVH